MIGIEQKLKIVIDFDDVLVDCNGYALRLLSAEDGVLYDVRDITAWGCTGKPVDKRLKFFSERFFFETQVAFHGAVEFMDELMKRGDVTIVTAIDPRFVGERMRRISELFPNFPLDHVILGSRKDIVQADVMIDDGLHNLLAANCRLPVLFDQPWNRSVSGICRVRGYDEILALVDFVAGKSFGSRTHDADDPKVVCLVGPSGGSKHEVADLVCSEKGFRRVGTVTTAQERRNTGRNVSAEEFERLVSEGAFLEHAWYTGDRYGVLKADVERVLADGDVAVMVMDVSGCLSTRIAYPGKCRIFYVDREKRDCVESIILKKGLTPSQMTDRIMSIDFERKNHVLADRVVGSSLSVQEQAAEVRNLI